MMHHSFVAMSLAFTLLFISAAQAQVVPGGMRGDRAYGISLAPTPLKVDKPTAAQISRSQQVMARGETLENFEGDYPTWIGYETVDVTRSTTLTIRDNREWADLWLRIGQPQPIDLPKNRFAIAILAGPRESEGYHLRVTDIRKVGQGLHIVYLESKPMPSEISAKRKKPTSPWLIKLIPEVQGTIRFFSSGK